MPRIEITIKKIAETKTDESATLKTGQFGSCRKSVTMLGVQGYFGDCVGDVVRYALGQHDTAGSCSDTHVYIYKHTHDTHLNITTSPTANAAEYTLSMNSPLAETPMIKIGFKKSIKSPNVLLPRHANASMSLP